MKFWREEDDCHWDEVDEALEDGHSWFFVFSQERCVFCDSEYHIGNDYADDGADDVWHFGLLSLNKHGVNHGENADSSVLVFLHVGVDPLLEIAECESSGG